MRMSSRASSAHVRSVVHSVRRASWEISTVGPRCDGIAIERQQPVPSERVQQSPDPTRLVQLLHVDDESAASRPGGVALVVDADQSEQDASRRL